MKLTNPPEVHELPAERVEQLRTRLVAKARRQVRSRTGPRWLPIVAAAAGVAMVAAGLAAVDRFGTGPSPVRTAPVTTQAPAKPGVVNLDLGPAGESDARQMIGKCLAPSPGQPIKPADPFTIEWARWMTKLVSRHDGNWQDKPTRQLVAVVTSADRQYQAWCQDGVSRWSGTTGAAPWGTVTGGDSGDSGASKQPGHPWAMMRMFALNVAPHITQVELRYRWQGGATPWYAGYVDTDSLTGYVEAAATGRRGAPPADAKLEVRAFDDTGRMIYTHAAGKDDPIN